MTDEHNLVRWSEALAGIARTGLAFTENLYERERYEEVLNVAADIQAHITDADNPKEKIDEWMRSDTLNAFSYHYFKSTFCSLLK